MIIKVFNLSSISLVLFFANVVFSQTKVASEDQIKAQIVPDIVVDVKALHQELDNKLFLSKNLVPKNYMKSAEAIGDLNSDGINDIAILIKPIPEKAKKRKDGSIDFTGLFYSIPQVVLVYLGQKEGNYKLWKLGDSHFINSSSNLAVEDGIGLFKISKGVLVITTHPNLSFGMYYDEDCTQKWRMNKLDFQLIGLTKENLNNLTRCSEKVDINYLSGDKIVKFSSAPEADCKKNNKILKSKLKAEVVLWEKFDHVTLCGGEN